MILLRPSHSFAPGLALLGLVLGGCYVGPGLGSSGKTASAGLSSTGDSESAGDSESEGESESSTGGSGSDSDSDSEGSSGGITATEGTTEGTTGTTDGTSTSGTTTGTSTSTTGTSTSTTGTSSSSSGTSTGGMGAYCDGDDDWMGSWSTMEEEVVTLVNQRRSQGANCGSKGDFGSASPLTMHPLLRCAARLHSKDMVVREFFDHTNPDNESPWDRIAKTGYGGYQNAGENIAAGSATAAAVVDQWMNSDGHCANIMNPAFNEIGVGYYPGGQYGHVWTQVFTKK